MYMTRASTKRIILRQVRSINESGRLEHHAATRTEMYDPSSKPPYPVVPPLGRQNLYPIGPRAAEIYSAPILMLSTMMSKLTRDDYQHGSPKSPGSAGRGRVLDHPSTIIGSRLRTQRSGVISQRL